MVGGAVSWREACEGCNWPNADRLHVTPYCKGLNSGGRIGSSLLICLPVRDPLSRAGDGLCFFFLFVFFCFPSLPPLRVVSLFIHFLLFLLLLPLFLLFPILLLSLLPLLLILLLLLRLLFHLYLLPFVIQAPSARFAF